MISLYQVRVDNFSIYNPGYPLLKAVINYNNNNINISEVYEEQKVDKNNYIKRKLKWINSLKFTGFNLIFFGGFIRTNILNVVCSLVFII